MTQTTTGGADWEIGEAARKLSAALGVDGAQADALRIALSDHAAAVGSKSTSMIAALITPLLTGQLETREAIAALAEQNVRIDARQQNADVAALNWRTELRTHIDGQFDRIYTELDRLGGLEARVERVEVGQVKLEIKVESLEIHGAPAKAIDEIHLLRGEIEAVRSLLVVTRRQLWLTWIPIATFVVLVVATLMVRGWR